MRYTSVVITGVSRGLGRALALEFAKLGLDVFCCSPHKKGNPAHPNIRLTHLDITDADAVKRWTKKVLNQQRIDILINNAGIILEPQPFWQIPPKQFEKVIQTNLSGTVNVLRGFMPALVAQRRALIVNLLSGGAQTCISGNTAYNASKWALEGLTRTLAKEVPASICVVGLMPGAINTVMLRKVIGKQALKNPSAQQRAEVIAPFLLSLKVSDNGRVLNAPLPRSCEH